MKKVFSNIVLLFRLPKMLQKDKHASDVPKQTHLDKKLLQSLKTKAQQSEMLKRVLIWSKKKLKRQTKKSRFSQNLTGLKSSKKTQLSSLLIVYLFKFSIGIIYSSQKQKAPKKVVRQKSSQCKDSERVKKTRLSNENSRISQTSSSKQSENDLDKNYFNNLVFIVNCSLRNSPQYFISISLVSENY